MQTLIRTKSYVCNTRRGPFTQHVCDFESPLEIQLLLSSAFIIFFLFLIYLFLRPMYSHTQLVNNNHQVI